MIYLDRKSCCHEECWYGEVRIFIGIAGDCRKSCGTSSFTFSPNASTLYAVKDLVLFMTYVKALFLSLFVFWCFVVFSRVLFMGGALIALLRLSLLVLSEVVVVLRVQSAVAIMQCPAHAMVVVVVLYLATPVGLVVYWILMFLSTNAPNVPLMLFQAHVPLLQTGTLARILLPAYVPPVVSKVTVLTLHWDRIILQITAISATPALLLVLGATLSVAYPAIYAHRQQHQDSLALMQPDIMVAAVLLRALYQHFHLTVPMVFAPPAILCTLVLLG